MKKELTVKGLRLSVKNGKTFEQVQAEFGFETSDDLRRAIEELDPESSKTIKALKRASKAARKQEARQRSNEQVDVEKLADVPAAETTTVVEDMKPVQEPRAEKEAYAEAAIEILEKQEKTLSQACISLEEEHKGKMTRRRAIEEKLSESLKTLNSLKEIASNILLKVEALEIEYSSLKEDMVNISSELNLKKAELEGIRARIEAFKTPQLLVYSSGQVECENFDLPEPSEEEIRCKIDEIIANDSSEDLTLKQVKVLARLLLAEIPENAEIAFDSETMEVLFNSLR